MQHWWSEKIQTRDCGDGAQSLLQSHCWQADIQAYGRATGWDTWGQFWCRGRWELSVGKQQQNLCLQQREDPLRGNLQQEICPCLGRKCLYPSSSKTWLSAVACCACSSSAPCTLSHLEFSLSPASIGGSTPTASGHGVPVSSEGKSYDFGSFVIFSNPFLRRRNSQKPRCLHADGLSEEINRKSNTCLAFSSLTLFSYGVVAWETCGALRSSLHKPQHSCHIIKQKYSRNVAKLTYNYLVYWGGEQKKALNNIHFSGAHCAHRRGMEL